MNWRLVFVPRTLRDARKLSAAGLRDAAQRQLVAVQQDPVAGPLQVTALVGDLAEAYSCRISIQHRLVYQVLAAQRIIKVLRMWTQHE
ncbi:MAG: addiction module toxin, Txe/YoeB family [Nevskia sp.]|nr:addiction module toxin, Txe/YoeB family [Nevskia sp.]